MYVFRNLGYRYDEKFSVKLNSVHAPCSKQSKAGLLLT